MSTNWHHGRLPSDLKRINEGYRTARYGWWMVLAAVALVIVIGGFG